MANTNTSATNNYIMGGVGYMALLAAIVEQARIDANKGDKDAEVGIAEWADIALEDVNFKVWEQSHTVDRTGHQTGVLFVCQHLQYRTREKRDAIQKSVSCTTIRQQA